MNVQKKRLRRRSSANVAFLSAVSKVRQFAEEAAPDTSISRWVHRLVWETSFAFAVCSMWLTGIVLLLEAAKLLIAYMT